MLKPIFLQQIDLDQYKVIEGDLEYYAAVRAKEKNLRQGEMINAIIVSPAQEKSIKQQLDFFKKSQSLNVPEKRENNPSQTNFDGVESRILNIESRQNNLESRLNKVFDQQNSKLESINQKYDREIQEIKSQIPKKSQPLEAFNTLTISELAFRLKSANITGKTADKIIQNIERERSKKPFESLGDIIERIEGLGDKRMISILDTWSRTLFL
ncbi:DUF655 domain-containing protein [Capilliphycus salinus ALCB114379]|uniref:DUF655 domain-containing protein n=1 Tax=Capilliphycus salinus TaxID=2768948 RepID=UPI0039A76232